MTLQEYEMLIQKIQFNEYPLGFIAHQDYLSDILNFNEANLELKIYLTELILCRSFYGTYTAWYRDVTSFINSFFNEFQGDFIKPGLSSAIKETASMILSGDVFAKKIIATTFMFGVLEFYAKYKLGYRPLNYNFFDNNKKNYIKELAPSGKQRDLSIKSAFEYLQKQNLPVANALNRIDAFTQQRLSETPVKSSGWTPYYIADRLALARNSMLHGELHSFYDKGEYLLMIYILFNLYDFQDSVST